ncbi:response regulator [Desulfogranum mediterraneum]|uniref:response regulator n=1 Tax=Desulfogranum mediterraneum TaxID=160661 RepID=UPI00041A7BEE|nr:response regulator [Desulfogranum mediterraneum]
MDIFFPYIGISLVILVGVSAVVFLSKYGLRLKRLRHQNLEVEFSDNDAHPPDTAKKSEILHLERSNVSFLAAAVADCEKLELDQDAVVSFILREVERHAVMFKASFHSVSLIFSGYLLFLSWDMMHVSVERILPRTEAYPLSDSWNRCLSLYRQATSLPYRLQGSVRFRHPPELRRSIEHYRKLVAVMKDFSLLVKIRYPEIEARIRDLEQAFSELEFVASVGDLPAAAIKMEVLLSSTHKVLIDYAPAQEGHVQVREREIVESPPELAGGISVLVVDDHQIFNMGIKVILEKEGLNVVTVTSPSRALLYLVERYFDIVVTDFTMPDINGREIASSVKAASPETEVIMLTMHRESNIKFEATEQVPWDRFYRKEELEDEFMGHIRTIVKKKKRAHTLL